MLEKDAVISLEIEKNKKEYIRVKNVNTQTKTIEISDGIETYTVTFNQFAVLWTDHGGRFVQKID